MNQRWLFLGFVLSNQQFIYGQDNCYKSQYGQDRILNEYIFHDKRNGVFIDIGAYDGVHYSNTYFFEKTL